MPQNLLALNWKMNKTPSQAVSWAQNCSPSCRRPRRNWPSWPRPCALPGLNAGPRRQPGRSSARRTSRARIGRVHRRNQRGDARDVGARYVVVGHSERRGPTTPRAARSWRPRRRRPSRAAWCRSLRGRGARRARTRRARGLTLDQLRDSLSQVPVLGADQIVDRLRAGVGHRHRQNRHRPDASRDGRRHSGRAGRAVPRVRRRRAHSLRRQRQAGQYRRAVRPAERQRRAGRRRESGRRLGRRDGAGAGIVNGLPRANSAGPLCR